MKFRTRNRLVLILGLLIIVGHAQATQSETSREPASRENRYDKLLFPSLSAGKLKAISKEDHLRLMMSSRRVLLISQYETQLNSRKRASWIYLIPSLVNANEASEKSECKEASGHLPCAGHDIKAKCEAGNIPKELACNPNERLGESSQETSEKRTGIRCNPHFFCTAGIGTVRDDEVKENELPIVSPCVPFSGRETNDCADKYKRLTGVDLLGGLGEEEVKKSFEPLAGASGDKLKKICQRNLNRVAHEYFLSGKLPTEYCTLPAGLARAPSLEVRSALLCKIKSEDRAKFFKGCDFAELSAERLTELNGKKGISVSQLSASDRLSMTAADQLYESIYRSDCTLGADEMEEKSEKTSNKDKQSPAPTSEEMDQALKYYKEAQSVCNCWRPRQQSRFSGLSPACRALLNAAAIVANRDGGENLTKEMRDALKEKTKKKESSQQ